MKEKKAISEWIMYYANYYIFKPFLQLYVYIHVCAQDYDTKATALKNGFSVQP